MLTVKPYNIVYLAGNQVVNRDGYNRQGLRIEADNPERKHIPFY